MYNFSPIFFTLRSLGEATLYASVITGIYSILSNLIARDLSPLRIFLYYIQFTIPVGLIGFSTGLLTGLSRTSAVGSVLPATLALIGGLNIYVFGTDNKFKIVVGYCVCVFCFMLFLGMQTGAFEREAQRERYLIFRAQQEARILAVRRNLGLPESAPNWAAPDSK